MSGTSGDRALRSRWLLLVALGLAAVAIPGVLRLETDNSPEVFFPRESTELVGYRDLVDTFGTDRIVRWTLTGESLWSAAGMATFDRLVRSASTVGSARILDPRALLALDSRRGPEAVRERLASGVARELGWVDPAIESLSFAALLPHEPAATRRQALSALQESVESVALSPGLRLSTSGLPVLDQALDESSREILGRFFPLLVVLAGALLGIALRQRREVVCALLYVGFCLLLTLGGMGWLGVRLNLVVAVLPPVLFAIAMATAVHLLVRFRLRRSEGLTVEPAVHAARVEKGPAIVWAGLTTIVGFGSLAEAGSGPVRTLGIASSIGIAILTLAALTLLPALLLWFPTEASRRGQSSRNPFDATFGRLGGQLVRFSVKRRRWLVGFLLVSGLLGAAGWSQLSIESNALTYLAPSHPTREASQRLDALGLGGASIEVLLGASGCAPDEQFDRQAGLEALSALSRDLATLPGVRGVLGPAELARLGREGAAIPMGAASRFLPLSLEQGLRLLGREGDGRELVRRHLTQDGCRVRLTVLVPISGLEGFDPLAERLETMLAVTLPQTRVELTGEYPLLLQTQRQLLGVFTRSALLSSLGIAILFLVLTRSLSRTVVALLPNLWPVVVVLGLMGWLDWPLDIATVMVAAVILGLAVDDTVHTLAAFETECRRGFSAAIAVERVLTRAAPAYVLTSVLLAVGFGVCALSSFAPTARFGGLAAFAMLFVLVGALVLLPALLGRPDGSGHRGLGSPTPES